MIPSILEWFRDPATWSMTDGVPGRLVEHLWYTLITIVIAAAVAVPLGLWVGHTGRGKWLVSVANSLRAVPTLGLLFVVGLAIGPYIPGDLAFTAPSIAVLVLLAVPPLLAGTYAGLEAVDPSARDAARGVGMRGRQVLWQVEVPNALPLMLSGLRSAVLQVVATATIAAFVGLGGLGRFLVDGIALSDIGQAAGGALVVAVLALVLEGALNLVQRQVVSPGLTGRAAGGSRRGGGSPEDDPSGIDDGSRKDDDRARGKDSPQPPVDVRTPA